MSDQVAESVPGRLRTRLPDNMVRQILIRLPAKSIFRFKTVSKPWNSIISDPSFYSSYISSNPSSSWFIVEQMQPAYPRFMNFPPELNFQELELKIIYKPFDKQIYPKLLASSNGLLLIAITWNIKQSNPNFFLINLITNETIQLTEPPHNHIGRTGLGLITQINKNNGVLEKFRVVDYQPRIETQFASLICFSSETTNWEAKSAKCINQNWMIIGGVGVFEFNGKLVWFDLRVGLMIWDDPFTEEDEVVCRFIDLPLTEFVEGSERIIDGGGGYIQFGEISKKESLGEFNMWRLNENEKWIKILTCMVRFPCSFPKPILIHPCNADFVFINLGDCIFHLDVKTPYVDDITSRIDNILTNEEKILPVQLPSWPISFPPCFYASLLNKHGHDSLMKRKFDIALDFYTNCIDLQYAATCNCEGLLHEFIKAYQARASAKKQLCNNEGYLEDLSSSLNLLKLSCRNLIKELVRQHNNRTSAR
ncbi:F-box protein At3g26010-like [Amaranthus tricolor]|uniref:F-box protein At3g26010-like n=1 Tax=Amaranthus tricolor TaxID=29722 RepID=UPI002582A6DE|nr:F-box protein At3g26010-like [Amaranthus tricolor]